VTRVLRLWHGSAVEIERFDPSATRDRGSHFGTREQAAMRNPAVLHAVEIEVDRVRRCRDRGDFASAIRSARAAGFDGLVYLNRYEGMTTERITALSDAGQLAGLDGLTDAQFRRLVPEARDSFIALDPDRIRVLDVIHRARQAAPARLAPVEADLDRLFDALEARAVPAPPSDRDLEPHF
jgi:hypothetical protein